MFACFALLPLPLLLDPHKTNGIVQFGFDQLSVTEIAVDDIAAIHAKKTSSKNTTNVPLMTL